MSLHVEPFFRASPQGVFGFERLAFIDGIGARKALIVIQGTSLDRWVPRASYDMLTWSHVQGGEITLTQVAQAAHVLMHGFQRSGQSLLGRLMSQAKPKRKGSMHTNVCLICTLWAPFCS